MTLTLTSCSWKMHLTPRIMIFILYSLGIGHHIKEMGHVSLHKGVKLMVWPRRQNGTDTGITVPNL